MSVFVCVLYLHVQKSESEFHVFKDPETQPSHAHAQAISNGISDSQKKTLLLVGLVRLR